MKQIFHYVFRGLLIVFSVGVVLLIVYKIYITFNVGDDVLFNDSHMMPQMKHINDEENGWENIKKAENVMYFPEEKSDLIDKMVTGENWDNAFAQELVMKNSDAFLYFDEALQKKYIVNPSQKSVDLKAIDIDFVIENTNFFRKLVKIRTIGVLYYFHEGQNMKGIDELDKITQFSYKIDQNERPLLIDVFINMSIHSTIEQANRYVLTKYALSREELNIIHKNRISIDHRDSLAHAFQLEYVVMKNSYNKMLYDPILLQENNIDVNRMRQPSFFWKPQQTQNMLMRHYEQAVQNSSHACNDVVPDIELKKIGYVSGIVQENGMGRTLINITEIPYHNVQMKRCRLEFQSLINDVAIASQLYRSEYGQFPISLTELDSKRYFAYNVADRMQIWDVAYDARTGQITQ